MPSDRAAPRLRLPIDWQVPGALTNRLGDRAGRQRAMSADGHLLLILHEAPTPGVSQRTGQLFWRNPMGNWRSTSHGSGIQALMEHLAEYSERVEALEKELESADSADDYYSLVRAVAPLHRSARNLHATLQQARELAPEDNDLINARDQSVEIERALDLLHNDASHGLDYTVARQAEHQAEATYQMAVAGYRLKPAGCGVFSYRDHRYDFWNEPDARIGRSEVYRRVLGVANYWADVRRRACRADRKKACAGGLAF